MKTTYINTLDGRTKIEWWEKEDFKGRNTGIYTAASTEDLIRGQNLRPLHVVPIPDDAIVCDFCNTHITDFPVPVMGTYALCKECYKNIKKEGGG